MAYKMIRPENHGIRDNGIPEAVFCLLKPNSMPDSGPNVKTLNKSIVLFWEKIYGVKPFLTNASLPI